MKTLAARLQGASAAVVARDDEDTAKAIAALRGMTLRHAHPAPDYPAREVKVLDTFRLDGR